MGSLLSKNKKEEASFQSACTLKLDHLQPCDEHMLYEPILDSSLSGLVDSLSDQSDQREASWVALFDCRDRKHNHSVLSSV